MSAADEERAFRQAILDAPDDDVPRLIFADWLDERGETTRAEFIRGQIAEPDHAQTLTPGAWLRPRLDAHGVADGEVELFEVPEWCESIVVRRGFVEAITLAWTAWHSHADALLTRHPIREVILTTTVAGTPPFPVQFVQSHLKSNWPGITFHLAGDQA